MGATGTWVEGEHIAGPGIPVGTTVTHVSGPTLTLSAKVEANGTEGAQTIGLSKGSKGEGYVALYEGSSVGTFSYHVQGTADKGVVISGKAGVRLGDNSRGSALLTQTSTGITLALAASATVTIFTSREIVLTNAAATITAIGGLHGTGQMVTFRATTTNTTFETGGNLNIAAGKLVLGVGDSATFLKTDYGAGTWVLTGVQRAKEELEWLEVEEVNAKFEVATGYAGFKCAVRLGIVYLRGVMTAHEEITASATLFKIPSAGHPETKRLLTLGNTAEKYFAGIVGTSGELTSPTAIKAATKVGVDGLFFPLKP